MLVWVLRNGWISSSGTPQKSVLMLLSGYRAAATHVGTKSVRPDTIVMPFSSVL